MDAGTAGAAPNPGPRVCPGCSSSRGFAPLEERRDPIGGVLYRLWRCGACGLTFSEPRDPVGPEWYEKSEPLRAREAAYEPARDWRFRRFLSAGLAPGKVLDLGCGRGGFMELAARAGWKAVGVDYEARMVELARARGLDAHAQDFVAFLKGRAAKEFDAVVLFDVLEHAPEPAALLAAIKPVLKRGGHLAITFPNADRPHPFGVEAYDYPPHHFTRWTPRALRVFLESRGFAIVVLTTVGPSVYWASETLFYGLIAPPALALAKRLFFGRRASGTITDLYAASGTEAPGAGALLADKGRRQDLVAFFKRACRLATWPLGLLLALGCRLKPGSGEDLYCLSRYDG